MGDIKYKIKEMCERCERKCNENGKILICNDCKYIRRLLEEECSYELQRPKL